MDEVTLKHKVNVSGVEYLVEYTRCLGRGPLCKCKRGPKGHRRLMLYTVRLVSVKKKNGRKVKLCHHPLLESRLLRALEYCHKKFTIFELSWEGINPFGSLVEVGHRVMVNRVSGHLYLLNHNGEAFVAMEGYPGIQIKDDDESYLEAGLNSEEYLQILEGMMPGYRLRINGYDRFQFDVVSIPA